MKERRGIEQRRERMRRQKERSVGMRGGKEYIIEV